MTKALFLDRDGIIIYDAGYARDSTLVRLKPDILPLLKSAARSNYQVFIVTNQSGLGRGWITLQEYKQVSERMLELLGDAAAEIEQIYFAPFYSESEGIDTESFERPFSSFGILQQGRWDRDWRKPKPGMLLTAAEQHHIDLSASLMVGDRASDVLAALSAGLGQAYLLETEVLATELNELQRALAVGPRHSGAWKTISDLTEISLVPE